MTEAEYVFLTDNLKNRIAEQEQTISSQQGSIQHLNHKIENLNNLVSRQEKELLMLYRKNHNGDY